MRCPYYKVVLDNKKPRSVCTLFDGMDVNWDTDCKKCVGSVEVRISVWNRLVYQIQNRLLSQIPDEWSKIDFCEYKGNVLPNVTATETCCGGKRTQVPMFECRKDNMPKTEKECLKCLAQRK